MPHDHDPQQPLESEGRSPRQVIKNRARVRRQFNIQGPVVFHEQPEMAASVSWVVVPACLVLGYAIAVLHVGMSLALIGIVFGALGLGILVLGIRKALSPSGSPVQTIISAGVSVGIALCIHVSLAAIQPPSPLNWISPPLRAQEKSARASRSSEQRRVAIVGRSLSDSVEPSTADGAAGTNKPDTRGQGERVSTAAQNSFVGDGELDMRFENAVVRDSNGQDLAYRVYDFQQDSFLGRMGFEIDDEVYTVNDVSIFEYLWDKQIQQAIYDSGRITVGIKRDGKPIYLGFDLCHSDCDASCVRWTSRASFCPDSDVGKEVPAVPANH